MNKTYNLFAKIVFDKKKGYSAVVNKKDKGWMKFSIDTNSIQFEDNSPAFVMFYKKE